MTTADVNHTMACFEDESRRVIDDLRAELTDLFAQVGVDPSNSQETANQLGVNKTLAWKISRIFCCDEVREILPQLPGGSGMEILYKALLRAGGRKDTVTRARKASEAINEVVQVHVSDKSTLELVLDGMGSNGTDRLELSRRLMFRGASGVWGVQARTRMGAGFIVPNADDPARLDLVIIGGFHDFRRLRRGISWPLFRLRHWSDEHGEPSAMEAIDLEAPPEMSGMMPDYCTPGIEVHKRSSSDLGTDYILEPGPVGNTGSLDIVYGELGRGVVQRYADTNDDIGEFSVQMTTPVDLLQFDIFAHESLAFALRPEVLVMGRAFMQGEHTNADGTELSRLPIASEIRNIPGSPPSVATPAFPQYPGIVDRVFSRLGVPGTEMRGVRMTLSHPPMGSTVVLRFSLPENPNEPERTTQPERTGGSP